MAQYLGVVFCGDTVYCFVEVFLVKQTDISRGSVYVLKNSLKGNAFHSYNVTACSCLQLPLRLQKSDKDL